MRLGVWALALAVAVIVWFNQFQDSSAAATAQRAADLFDGRPVRSILIIGNSRTFYNGMPSMLREIADSANSPAKFQVESSAFPGARFEDHWANERSKRLLAAGWDDIVLQSESRAQSTEEMNASFHTYGAKLAGIARLNQGRPRLVVNWAYDPSEYEGDTDGAYRDQHIERIKWNHTRLASENNLATIRLAGLWESVRRSHPSIRLTSDGNLQPSPAAIFTLWRSMRICRTGRLPVSPMSPTASCPTMRGRCGTQSTASRCWPDMPIPVQVRAAPTALSSPRPGP